MGANKYGDPMPAGNKKRGYRKRDIYKPDEADIARQERRKMEDGRFINCRHHPECVEEGKDCTHCKVCPNCGGNMLPDFTHVILNFKRHRVLGKSCMQCGFRYEGLGIVLDHEPPVPQKPQPPKTKISKPPKFPPYCSVDGCKRRTWEGYRFEGLRVCLQHNQKAKRAPVFERIGDVLVKRKK